METNKLTDQFPLEAKFFEDMILTVFENFELSDNHEIGGGRRYSFYGKGGYKGDITFRERDINIYIDNYPGPKQYFHSNVPIKTFLDFQRLLTCCGYTPELK